VVANDYKTLLGVATLSSVGADGCSFSEGIGVSIGTCGFLAERASYPEFQKEKKFPTGYHLLTVKVLQAMLCASKPPVNLAQISQRSSLNS
jgi:hypothetical protein